MEDKTNTKKVKGAWIIHVREASTGQSIGTECSPACSEAMSYPDNQENATDGKEG